MEAKSKELYEAPSTKVVEVKFEGIVCASGGTENYNRNDPDEW